MAKRKKREFKKYFIPNAKNNFLPDILHTKRAVLYSLFFLSCKAIVFLFALALPVAVFTSPDVLSQEAKKITILTNKLRDQHNVTLLASNDKLALSATAKAVDMAQKSYFSHTSPNGQTVVDFVAKTGYHYAVVGENLAVGFATADDVMAAWKKSPMHMSNLMDKDYIDLGVSMEEGTYKGQETVFAVQHFGQPTGFVISGVKPILGINSPTSTASQFASSTTDNTASGMVMPTSANEPVKAVLAEKFVAPAMKDGEVVGKPFWESPLQKYEHVKQIYASSNIFDFSQNLFLFAIIFFSISLALSVFIEFKKQYPHIIIQTSGLIGLLIVLFLV